MNDSLSLFLVVALPPAAIVFLALVRAQKRLRIGLTAAVFFVPLAILAWLLAVPGVPSDAFARLGFVALAFVLLAGAVAGAVLGGMVVGLRYLRRRRQTS